MPDQGIANLKTKPERSLDELDRMLKANDRRKVRHEPVTVSLRRMADGTLDLESPHGDTRGWQIRLADAFGTRSDTFALGQLKNLVGMLHPDDPMLEIEANTMLAAVEAVRPENEIEGMLAVQMATTHRLAMECLHRSAGAVTPEEMEANGKLATRLLRSFSTQFEVLAKARRGGAQKVTVKHVHVHEGGQAIVGNVAASGGPAAEGRVNENERQPRAPEDERALAPPAGDPLRSPDPVREPVSVTSGEGKEAVSDAWRELPKWSPER